MRPPNKPQGLYALLVYGTDDTPMLGTTSRLPLSLDDCASDLIGATRAEIVLFVSLKQAVRWTRERVDSRLLTAKAGLSLLSALALRFGD